MIHLKTQPLVLMLNELIRSWKLHAVKNLCSFTFLIASHCTWPVSLSLVKPRPQIMPVPSCGSSTRIWSRLNLSQGSSMQRFRLRLSSKQQRNVKRERGQWSLCNQLCTRMTKPVKKSKALIRRKGKLSITCWQLSCSVRYDLELRRCVKIRVENWIQIRLDGQHDGTRQTPSKPGKKTATQLQLLTESTKKTRTENINQIYAPTRFCMKWDYGRKWTLSFSWLHKYNLTESLWKYLWGFCPGTSVSSPFRTLRKRLKEN